MLARPRHDVHRGGRAASTRASAAAFDLPLLLLAGLTMAVARYL